MFRRNFFPIIVVFTMLSGLCVNIAEAEDDLLTLDLIGLSEISNENTAPIKPAQNQCTLSVNCAFIEKYGLSEGIDRLIIDCFLSIEEAEEILMELDCPLR